jgi:hypothetical protein
MVKEDKYSVYTSVFMMEGCDLYSDTDTDPIITAELDAISQSVEENPCHLITS